MTNLHAAIPAEQLTEAYRLLLEMRDNCVKHEDDQYDDPKREAKYEALNIAITAMGRSIPPRWISVEERLPENYISVIGYLPIDDKEGLPPTREVYRTDKGWFAPSLGELCIVTHWMSMPEGFMEV